MTLPVSNFRVWYKNVIQSCICKRICVRWDHALPWKWATSADCRPIVTDPSTWKTFLHTSMSHRQKCTKQVEQSLEKGAPDIVTIVLRVSCYQWLHCGQLGCHYYIMTPLGHCIQLARSVAREISEKELTKRQQSEKLYFWSKHFGKQ